MLSCILYEEIVAMTTYELVEKLITNIAVLALTAEILSRIRPLQEAILNERRKWQQDIVLSLIFGGIIIMSTAIGVNIGSYSLDTKAIGAITAGLLGGPVVGFLSSCIGALYELFFSVPKVFARSAAFSTILCGLLGAGFYPYFQRGKWKYKDLFVLACFGELVEMVSLIRITVSLQVAVDAILDAAIPMTLMNSIGILIFISCFNTVFVRQDLESSRQLQQMLELTKHCMPLFQGNLEKNDSMNALVSMIIEETQWAGAMIMDRDRMLAWKIVSDIDIKSPMDHMTDVKEAWRNLGLPEEAWESSEVLEKYLAELKGDNSEEVQKNLKILRRLWGIPEIAEKALETKQMVTVFRIPETSVWYRTMRECSVVAAPFVIEEQSVGCLVVFMKKQWTGRKSELDMIENLVTIASYQIAVRELEKRKSMLQKAEFKALQFQVNPHFLFNALNTIASVCREDPERSRELLITLADYFRYNLDYEAYMVPLKEELDHVKDYLELERARFEEKLIVSYDVPERMDVMIPTLILQPIVENAVRHGISADGKRIVDIRIREEEDAFIVDIGDKGRGFKPDVLEKLETGEAIGNSIGLSNVHKRMKNIYGENHGLKIMSTDHGSVVEMCFYKNV